MRKRPVTAADFTTFPEYLFPINPDARGLEALATAMTLTHNEDKWIRLSAETQKRMLGRNFFGHKRVRLYAGQLQATWKVCFGTDYEIVDINAFRFAHDPNYKLG
jgi:hypothetical protein